MKLERLLVWVLLALLLAGAPALAADDDEDDDGDAAGESAFMIGVQGAFTAPSGGNSIFTLQGPDDGHPAGAFRNAEIDDAVAPRVFLGWRTPGGGTWSLTWSQWDDDTTTAFASGDTDVLWDTLYHADDAWDEYTGTATAVRGVDASTIDLAYSRPAFQSGKLSARWMFGVRQADLDHGLDVEYFDTTDTEIHRVALGSEASGFGVVGGVSGTVRLSERWFVNGGFQYAFLSGTVEASTLMLETDEAGTFVDLDADVTSDEDRAFSMFGASLSLVWNPTEPLYVWVGWEFTQWNDVVDTHLFPDDVSEGFVQTDSTAVSFDGFTVGVGFMF